MKAIIYGRVSTVTQETQRQVADIKALAKLQGYEILDSFTDKISGTTNSKDRKAFSAMVNYLKDNDVKQIYAWELSRIGRSNIDIHLTIKGFREAGINIHILKEQINTAKNDATSNLLLGTLASLAEYELESIKSRTMSGMANSIRNGGVGGGVIKQYGYKNVNDKLVIDEDEADIIRDIFNMYLSGTGLIAIANTLNVNGKETRLKKMVDAGSIKYKNVMKTVWTASTVCKLLHTKLYTGFRKYGATEIQLENLRIIDTDIYEAVQIKMAGKRYTLANAAKWEHIFKGVLYCGHCGGILSMKKNNSTNSHYMCFNRFRMQEGCTDARTINIDLLNNVVYHLTKDFQVDSATVLAKIAVNMEQIQHSENALHSIAENLKDLEVNRQQVLKSFDAKFRTEAETANRLAEISAEVAVEENKKAGIMAGIAKLNKEIEMLNSTKAVDLTNPLIFKANIKSLIKKISVATISKETLKGIEAKTGAKIITPVSVRFSKDGELSEHNRISLNDSKRNILYSINVIMFDGTIYGLQVNSLNNDIPKVISIEKK